MVRVHAERLESYKRKQKQKIKKIYVRVRRIETLRTQRVSGVRLMEQVHLIFKLENLTPRKFRVIKIGMKICFAHRVPRPVSWHIDGTNF